MAHKYRPKSWNEQPGLQLSMPATDPRQWEEIDDETDEEDDGKAVVLLGVRFPFGVPAKATRELVRQTIDQQLHDADPFRRRYLHSAGHLARSKRVGLRIIDFGSRRGKHEPQVEFKERCALAVTVAQEMVDLVKARRRTVRTPHDEVRKRYIDGIPIASPADGDDDFDDYGDWEKLQEVIHHSSLSLGTRFRLAVDAEKRERHSRVPAGLFLTSCLQCSIAGIRCSRQSRRHRDSEREKGCCARCRRRGKACLVEKEEAPKSRNEPKDRDPDDDAYTMRSPFAVPPKRDAEWVSWEGGLAPEDARGLAESLFRELDGRAPFALPAWPGTRPIDREAPVAPAPASASAPATAGMAAARPGPQAEQRIIVEVKEEPRVPVWRAFLPTKASTPAAIQVVVAAKRWAAKRGK